jgi:NAD(P)-dependent dehydrogenase (short-subunit alcohol dehydrogenase family)
MPVCPARTATAEKEIVIMTSIADRTVLVTGGNRGIGRALVEEALNRGAALVYAGTRGPLAHADARVTPLMLDVTDAMTCHRGTP